MVNVIKRIFSIELDNGIILPGPEVHVTVQKSVITGAHCISLYTMDTLYVHGIWDVHLLKYKPCTQWCNAILHSYQL